MNTHISLELAKWLNERGCEIESVQSHVIFENSACCCSKEGCDCVRGKYHTNQFSDLYDGDEIEEMEEKSFIKILKVYPAYSWLDLLVAHAKEFWGERQPIIENQDEPWKGGVCLHCKIDWRYQPPRESGCNHVHHPEACNVCLARSRGWQDYTEKLLKLIQENPYQAEAYVRENSLFSKKDQGENR